MLKNVRELINKFQKKSRDNQADVVRTTATTQIQNQIN